MRIGFDFDKVFVDFPPLVPDFFIEYLYKNHKKKTKKKDIYRFPGKIEQKIRIISHVPIFRKPIPENIKVLQKLSKDKNAQIYLVSSRFSFLKRRTEILLKTYNLEKYFRGIYFNFEDQQPHEFKYNRITELKLDYYIDDDLDLLKYLHGKKIATTLFWLDGKAFINKKNVPKDITTIHSLSDIFSYIKNGK